ncbi:MAG: hypothetical protein IJH79_20820 [Lentisphaeria bacterium]|nr:hypothetical protein [Lentisphaeria bacterium]
MRNGHILWYDEVYNFTETSTGKKYLAFMYTLDDPDGFFGTSWSDMGYDSPEEYEESVWQRFEIRYCIDDGTWEARRWIDTETTCDSFPFPLTDAEKDEVDEMVRLIREEGELDPEKYSWKN